MDLQTISDSRSTLEFNSTQTLDRRDTDLDKEYDPFANRNVDHPSSTVGSFFNLLKSSLGSGLLAMPAAFKHAGLVVGAVGIVVVSVVATHCVHILVKTSHSVCRRCRVPSLNYADTCERVFRDGPRRLKVYSTHVKNFVNYAMAGVCLGGTSVYVIFIASAVKDVSDNFCPNYKLSIQVYCAILLVPLILITQLRHLKFLVPFSVFANACLFVIFGITCYYTFNISNVSQRSLMVPVSEWPLFVSTAIFAMEGINVVMPVENEMARPEHFLGCPGILNVTMICVAVLYGVVGMMGYLRFGEDVQGNVVLNLPEEDILALIAKILVILAVLFTYCLQMYAPMEIIWNSLRDRITKRHHNIAEILVRTSFVTLTGNGVGIRKEIAMGIRFGSRPRTETGHEIGNKVALAAAVPDLELLIGLVGAIFFSTLGLLIPVVVETVHKWEHDLGSLYWVLWKNLILLLFYVLILLSGCYTATVKIIDKFFK